MLFQAEIAALQLQLKASQSGGLDLAAVSEEEAAVSPLLSSVAAGVSSSHAARAS